MIANLDPVPRCASCLGYVVPAQRISGHVFELAIGEVHSACWTVAMNKIGRQVNAIPALAERSGWTEAA